MSEKNWVDMITEQLSAIKVMETNSFSKKYDLILSEEDAELILSERKHTLKEQRRIEFGQSIISKIIYEFCDSDYINQENYAETIIRLQNTFYLYKNEMMDEVTDDELIHFMKEQFEMICYGDIEYLEETCLDIFSQAVRSGYRGYQRTEGRAEYAQFDEVTRWDKELYLDTLKELCWR